MKVVVLYVIMSSRQRQRLQKKETYIQQLHQQNNNISIENDIEEDEDEVSESQNRKVMQYYLDSSSQDSSSSESDNDIELKKTEMNEITSCITKKNKLTAIRNEKEIIDDEKFLEEQIRKNNELNEINDLPKISEGSTNLFAISPKDIDMEAIMHQRFGRLDLSDDEDKAKKSKKKNKNRFIVPRSIKSYKKYYIVQPQEDWGKPLHYISGGQGMDQVKMEGDIKYFSFKWSSDYEKLNDDFIEIQNSGDANNLVLFLSQYPYHTEGLLTLAMVFARTANMDRATDLVKRCLYYLESTFLESFKLFEGKCRVDVKKRENIALYSALFRHMQISYMMGCPSVSAGLARIILSLDPIYDPYHLLLMLDHYFITSGKHELLCQYLGIQSIENLESKLQSLIDLYFPQALQLGEGLIDDNSLTIGRLPNWIFSLAVALFQLKHRSLANIVLENAIVRYPYMTNDIIQIANIETKKNKRWEVILQKPFFTTSKSRVDPDNLGVSRNVLMYLSRLYAILNTNIWKREDLQLFLLESCEKSLSFYSSHTNVNGMNEQMNYYKILLSQSEIVRYKDAIEEDFQEQFNRFPPNVNPLDPQMADPRLLQAGLEQNRIRGGRNMLNRLLRGHNDVGAMDQEAILAEFERLREMGMNMDFDEFMNMIQQGNVEGVGDRLRDIIPRGNLDPNLPLLQLFLQTLLPWNRLDAE